MKYTIVSTVICFIAIHVCSAHDQIPGAPQSQPIVLTNATIHPITQPTLENATLVFADGKISQIGQDIDLPSNCQVIDVKGQHVYPGFIMGNSILGLVEIDAVRATRDYAEVGSIKPNVEANTAFNPDSERIPVTRKTGVLFAQVVPQRGRVPGLSSLMMLDGWTHEQMTLKSPLALHIHWPSMSINRENENESKENRDEALRQIQDTFDQARAYWKAKSAEEKAGIPYHDVDTRWEAMKPILDGEVPVIVHAEDIRQMQSAIEWAKEEQIKLIFQGARDAWRIADVLRENEVPVMIDAPHHLGFRRWEPYDTAFTLASKLHEAGVKFCFSFTGENANDRNFPFQVASSVAYGLPREAALKAITYNAAEIFGVHDRIGSLEPGKDASLFVCNGDPLDLRSSVTHMYMQGRLVELESRHTQLYDKYQTKYEQLDPFE